MDIKTYHFHIYFEELGSPALDKMTAKLKQKSGIAIGRVHNRPIGPHPIGSCQISVPKEMFEEILQFFLRERDGLTIFIHPLSGDDYVDHTDHVIWIGDPYPLKTDFFKAG